MKRSVRLQLLSVKKLVAITSIYVVALTAMLLFLLYISESSDIVGFAQFKPNLTIKQETNEHILTWPQLPYLAYYEVDVLSNPPFE